MGTTGRESDGDKQESFDGDVLGENWIRIGSVVVLPYHSTILHRAFELFIGVWK